MGGRLGRAHRARHLLLAPRLSWGGLRRTTPLHDGWSRGLPVDRPYIEHFFSHCAAHITGAVLEVQAPVYSMRFGAATSRHIFDMHAGPGVTIVADLAQPNSLPACAYDCVILPQTLQFVPAPKAAVRTLHRSLRPGGRLLVTVPCLSPVRTEAVGVGLAVNDLWRWTCGGFRHLLGEAFDIAAGDDIEVQGYGNVLSAVAFLQGLGAGELRPAEHAVHDEAFPLIVAAVATRGQ